MEPPLTTEGKDAWRRVIWTLRRADLAVQRAKEPGLRAVGVPQAHYALLMHVHAFPGYSGAEIGRGLGVTTKGCPARRQAGSPRPTGTSHPPAAPQRQGTPHHRRRLAASQVAEMVITGLAESQRYAL